MIKVEQALLVEGKYDAARLANIVDGTILTTDGFRVFRDAALQKLLKRIAAAQGLIILTDSDAAGFKIRHFVTGLVGAEHVLQAYVPALYGALGVFIPLIVVNCIILGRAEAFASKNSPLDSILDGVGIGLGFTLALTVIGAVREILGSGAIFGVNLGFADVAPLIFVLAPGAFLVLGYLMVLFNKLAKK